MSGVVTSIQKLLTKCIDLPLYENLMFYIVSRYKMYQIVHLKISQEQYTNTI